MLGKIIAELKIDKGIVCNKAGKNSISRKEVRIKELTYAVTPKPITAIKKDLIILD